MSRWMGRALAPVMAVVALGCGSDAEGELSGEPLFCGAESAVGRIAQKVRTSGPVPSGSADATDGTGGPMPFFEPDELSTEDLRDLIAYVRSGA